MQSVTVNNYTCFYIILHGYNCTLEYVCQFFGKKVERMLKFVSLLPSFISVNIVLSKYFAESFWVHRMAVIKKKRESVKGAYEISLRIYKVLMSNHAKSI